MESRVPTTTSGDGANELSSFFNPYTLGYSDPAAVSREANQSTQAFNLSAFLGTTRDEGHEATSILSYDNLQAHDLSFPWTVQAPQEVTPAEAQNDGSQAFVKRPETPTPVQNRYDASSRRYLNPLVEEQFQKFHTPDFEPFSAQPLDIPVSASYDFQEDLTPFGRWRNSPPEDEHISAAMIEDNIAQSVLTGHQPRTEYYSHSDSSRGGDDSYLASLIGAAPLMDSKPPSSIGSDTSQGSHSSNASTKRQSRRRRKPRIARVAAAPNLNEKRRYQCTFCTDMFRTKHDWQRHEATLHLSLQQWQCLLTGPAVPNEDGTMVCVFCEAPEPNQAHFEQHSYTACAAKPLQSRCFYRKDHLHQHLRLFHNGSSFNSHMDKWVFSLENVKSRCGFCDATLMTWPERAKHLARHFRHGAEMKDWKGDHGFEDWVYELVENDMPPYLIDEQRRTPEPFSATKTGHRVDGLSLRTLSMKAQQKSTLAPLGSVPEVTVNVPGGDTSMDAALLHSYRYTEKAVLEFIRLEIMAGRVPTDSAIQQRGIEVLYGTTNPDLWDQTWFDNPLCLQQVKERAGLISLPLSGGKNAYIGQPVKQSTPEQS